MRAPRAPTPPAPLHPHRRPVSPGAARPARARQGDEGRRRATAKERCAGSSIACIFEKPSTRTRVSFAAAIARLGATPIALSPQELQLGRGESIADTARSLSGYVVGDRDQDVRAGDRRRAGALGDGPGRQRALRQAPPVPGAGRRAHDRGAVRQRSGRRLAFVGDGGDNVAHSLLEIGSPHRARRDDRLSTRLRTGHGRPGRCANGSPERRAPRSRSFTILPPR